MSQTMVTVFPKLEGCKISEAREVIANGSSNIELMKNVFSQKLLQRAIPGVVINNIDYNDNSFIEVKKIFDDENYATSILSLKPYGNDIVIETQHYEYSKAAATKNTATFTVWAIIGLIFVWTGIGAFVMFFGLYTIFSSTKYKFDGDQEEEVKFFKEAFRDTIMVSLSELNIVHTLNVKEITL